MIVVCPLSRLAATVERHRARKVVTLINDMTPLPALPMSGTRDHLVLGINDIVEPVEGLVAPELEHVEALLDFARGWDQADVLVIHCFAGISRSTAAAFTVACALAPARSELEIATDLRAVSPTATPNARIVALADRLLRREGRMVGAIGGIGRGIDAFEAEPFTLPLDGLPRL